MHPIKRLFYVTLSVLVLTAGIWTAYADSEKNPGRKTIRVGFFATDGLYMIDDGEIDMVTFANKTEERKEKYDFSRPIGFFGTALFVREDNRAVIPGDYSTYEGLRIGLVEDNAQNKDIANLAEAMHFNYQPVIYKSIKDVWASPSKKVRSMPS